LGNPGDDHWHALERVMHYLNGTLRYEIHSTGYPLVLEGYIVIQIGFQILMRQSPQVNMYSLLVVVLFHGNLASRLSLHGQQSKENSHQILQTSKKIELLIDFPMVEKTNSGYPNEL
jgi:hypothetical protein